jgi:hypothetical protein
VNDTWQTRELPVLTAVVELLANSYMVTVSDIAGRTGLTLTEVSRSLDALCPEYVDYRKTITGGDPRFWYVHTVTPEARRAAGQWPTPEGLVARFAAGFTAAAEREDDPHQQRRLTEIAQLLDGPLRDIAVRIAAGMLGAAEPSPAGAPAPG